MKKTLFLLLIVAFSASNNAQTSDKKWGIGAALGAYGTINQGGIGLIPEGYFLSRYLNPRFDLLFQGDLGYFLSTDRSNLDFANGFLNLRYKLVDESKNFRPYLYAGPGFLANNKESGLNFDIGLGGKYYISPRTAFYMEAGYIHGIETTTTAGLPERESYWKTTIGIELAFGKTKDTDMDGVSDNKDKCPNTPTGVAVDEEGCPVDDGDGITNSADICPNTPKGYKVDASGCPFDTDKDGVIDEDDACPTFAGPENNKGCPIETIEKIQKKAADQVIIQKISIDPVHFVSNKIYLTDFSKERMGKLILLLLQNTDYYVNIFGYTDNVGSSEYNLKLAQDRINTVVNYLISKGISKDRTLNQKAFGEMDPLESNNTPEGRLHNRRVIFEIVRME